MRALALLPDILDLDALARRAEAVAPGLPEASRVYQAMATRHMPYDTHHLAAGGSEPSEDEIAAVADWIAGLEAPRACVAGGADGPVGEAVERWVDGALMTHAERRQVVLVFLGARNVCRGEGLEMPARLLRAAELVSKVGGVSRSDFMVLAVPGAPHTVAFVPATGSEARFDRRAFSGLAVLQDAVARARLTVAGLFAEGLPTVLDLGWLARHAAGAGAAETAPLIGDNVRSVTLADAAAEVGMTARGLGGILADHDGREMAPARALRQGSITRSRWERLLLELGGLRSGIPAAVRVAATGSDSPPTRTPTDTISAAQGAPVVQAEPGVAVPSSPAVVPVPEARPEDVPAAFRDVLPDGLLLWSNPMRGRVGDEIVLSVESAHDCRLTLVNIEATGRATVLFPNMFTPDNRLQAGRTIEIPSEDDPYVLGLEAAGRETFVAICLIEERNAPPGIAHDFDIKPFTPLGDWRAHQRSERAADARERALAGQSLSRRKKRQLAREGILPRSDRRPLRQMRAAITVDIGPAEPRGSP